MTTGKKSGNSARPFRAFEGHAEPHEPFWTWRAQSDGDEPELEVYGIISEWSWFDDEITPRKFKDELYARGKGGPVKMRIDSPGGDPIAASTIGAIIAAYPGQVTARIDGQAASAAVMVALAAGRIEIQDSAYMMVHDPSVNVFLASLDIDTLTRLRDALSNIKQGMVASYAARTGLEMDRLNRMLADETWMNAQQAVELGFADEVVAGSQRQAPRQFPQVLSFYQHVPAALMVNQATEPPYEDPGEQDPESSAEPTEADEQAQEPAVEPSETEESDETQAVPGGAEGELEAVAPQARRTPYAARVTLAAQRIPTNGEPIMNLRELLAQRATLLDEAQTLADTADAEGRDFSETELARFDAILGTGEAQGELAALDVQIQQTQERRERLRAAAENQPAGSGDAEKPDGQSAAPLTRDQFEALDPNQARAYVLAGGKIVD